MIKATRAVALSIGAMACITSLRAHHSDRMIDGSTAIWLKGTVLRYEPMNPHAMIYLEVATESGQFQTWTVEGPRLGRLEGLGVDGNFLQVGDVIEICGFFPVGAVLALRPKPQFVHGKILVTPDGQKWAWGPYGRLKNCVDEDEWDSIARGTNPLRP
jgi:hypothetical protein